MNFNMYYMGYSACKLLRFQLTCIVYTERNHCMLYVERNHKCQMEMHKCTIFQSSGLCQKIYCGQTHSFVYLRNTDLLSNIFFFFFRIFKKKDRFTVQIYNIVVVNVIS